jgi:hypothetical protein
MSKSVPLNSPVTLDMSKSVPLDLSAGLQPKGGALPPGYTVEPPKDEASETRQMLVSGLTGMPTPNMTAQDRQDFASGKAAGAVSVPLVAGATTAAGLAAEFGPGALKVVTEMAKAHPTAAKFLAKVIGGAVLGHDFGHTFKGALLGALLSAGK